MTREPSQAHRTLAYLVSEEWHNGLDEETHEAWLERLAGFIAAHLPHSPAEVDALVDLLRESEATYPYCYACSQHETDAREHGWGCRVRTALKPFTKESDDAE